MSVWSGFRGWGSGTCGVHSSRFLRSSASAACYTRLRSLVSRVFISPMDLLGPYDGTKVQVQMCRGQFAEIVAVDLTHSSSVGMSFCYRSCVKLEDQQGSETEESFKSGSKFKVLVLACCRVNKKSPLYLKCVVLTRTQGACREESNFAAGAGLASQRYYVQRHSLRDTGAGKQREQSSLIRCF